MRLAPILTIIFFLIGSRSTAIAMSVEYMAEQADVIVEGRILQQSEIMIDDKCYTESLIAVSAVFKGEISINRLYVITRCKLKLKENEHVSDDRRFLLPKKSEGVFFLKNELSLKRDRTFRAFGHIWYLLRYRNSTSGKLFSTIEWVTRQKVVFLKDQSLSREALRLKIPIFSFLLLLVIGVFVASIYKS